MYRKLVVERLDPAFRAATRIVDCVLPVPKRTQALVRLCYAGINASDVNFSAGRYLPGASPPLDCGFEGVGIIEAAGSGAAEAGLARGTAVGVVKYGCFAEYILVDMEHTPTSKAPSCAIYPLESASAEAVPLLIGGLTSSIGLEKAGEMGSGETVLVTGAAGGTGIFAVQLAALAGNRVIGTCGSDDKVEVLKGMGCERAINYKTEDVEAVLKTEFPSGIDLVFEGVGGDMLEVCKRCLNPTTGRLVVMGFTSQYTKQDAFQAEEAQLVRSRGSGAIRGFLLKDYPHLTRSHLQKLQGLVDKGMLRSLCDLTEFSGLEQVADAVEHLHSAKNIGKVLVKLSSPDSCAEDTLGPLGVTLGDCVEVSGLASETGQKLNGQKGAVMTYSEDKGRYAVRLVPESVVNLKPDNVRRLERTQRFRSLQGEALAVLSSAEARVQLGALRAQCPDREQFERAKKRLLAAVLDPCCERHGVDMGWFERMSGEAGLADQASADMGRQLEALIDFDALEEAADCDDRDKLHRLLTALLGILCSDHGRAELARVREECTSKAEAERLRAERVYPLLGPAYVQQGVDWAWQVSMTAALRQTDEAIGEQCERLEEALGLGIGGPLLLDKFDCVEVSGLTSASGQQLNGQKAFAQSFSEEKGRYNVLFPPDNFVHLKSDNLRKISDREKLSAVLAQSLVRLGTPQAKAELDELRGGCETRDQFEAQRAERLAGLLERIFTRHNVDLAWMLAMCAAHAEHDEEIADQRRQLDGLISFGLGPLLLEKSACVEVSGIDPSMGGMKKLNGKRGFVQAWLEGKGCYAVKFPPDNYFVDLKAEYLSVISDRDKVANILTQALTRCKQAASELRELRSKAPDRQAFESGRGELLQSLLGGVCARYGVDLGWFFVALGHLGAADEELAGQRGELERLIAFDTGPLGLEKGECVRASDLELGEGGALSGRTGFVQNFVEGSGRYSVLFPPEKLVNLRPECVSKCNETEKLASFLEQAVAVLGAAKAQAELDELRAACATREQFEGAKGERLGSLLDPALRLFGVDLGWFAAAMASLGEEEEIAGGRRELEALLAFGTLGPLELDRSACVEIHGLESESGRQMNGQRGLVTRWVRDKERYEVKLGPEKVLTVRPGNVRRLDDRERLLALQQQLVVVMGAKEVQGPIKRMRQESTTSMQFAKATLKFMAATMTPAFEHYGVDAGWQACMLALYGEDGEVKAATKQLEELTGFGVVGPGAYEKGCYLEVHSLASEAGQKLNGTAVFLRGWDEEKGRYDVSPADDLGQTKALKPDNLRLIPEKHFSGIEEATRFQYGLIEAYSTPEAREMLAQLKASCPNMQHYVSALRPRLLEFQKPVLKHHGFRPDFVGQQYMQRALGPYEADPEFLQRNIETEQMLGLPERRT